MAALEAAGMRPAARHRRIAVPATPAPTARTDGGIELQAGFACGASVYDRGHGGQQRGYGAVLKAAGTADDGTARWYVDWAAGGRTGGRTTAIKETYLEVALIHNSARCPPTAIGQGVLVVLGNFKNSTGVIVGKCGEMWRCKLDGAGKGCQPFLSDYLHATAQPAPDAAILAPFTPTVLATALAADQVPAYLEGMQFDADNPIDLRRKKPDSEAWFDVLTGRQDIGDLPDDDLRQLHYVAAGVTAKPTSKTGSPLAAEEREALVAGLQRAAAGGWKIVFVCARSTACGCPYAIEFKHNGNGTVTVTQAEAHQFHDPSSAEDRTTKPIHPWRTKRPRSSAAAQEVAPENRCDTLPKLAKKGIAVNKVRGVTVPGNLDGTVLRNRAPHHRLPKQQQQRR